jgi:O-antigen/teichoic acid export membrane protein
LAALKKLASQTAVYGVSHIAGRFLNYLLVPLYTNIFSTQEYGINTQLYAYVAFFNVLLTYGMETAFFRFASKNDNAQQVFTTGMISLFFSSALFVLLASFFTPSIASFTRLSEHPEYIQYFIWILALDAMSALPFAFLRHHNKALKFAFIKNLNILINILLNLYFLLLCPHLISAHGMQPPFYNPQVGIGYIFISNLVASIVTLLFFVPEFNAIRKGKFDQTLWREMIRYAMPMMVVGFAGMINETLDRTLITWFYPEPEVGRAMNGIYGANYKLAILMTLFIQAFRYAAEPYFFAHAKQTDKRDVYAQVMNYFVAVCVFLFLLVTLFIDVFKYFIGAEFREGLHVVPVLLMANLFLGIYYNLSIWYKLSDQTGKGALISIVGAIITIVLNVWWIPLFGYTGAAWATLACYFSMTVICYTMGKKYYPIPYNSKRVTAYILAGLILYVLNTQAKLHINLTPLVSNGFSAVSIAVFVLLVWRFESKYKIVTSPD